jgi:hypothetical protein
MAETKKPKREKKPAIWVRRSGQLLVPSDTASALRIEDLAWDAEYAISPTRPRDGVRHRKFWAFCKLVARTITEGTGDYWDEQDVCDHFKRAAGHYDMRLLDPSEVDVDGPAYEFKMRSIAFDKFPNEEDFIRFFLRVVDHVRRNLCPHFEQGPYADQIAKIIRSVEWLRRDAA